MLNFLSQYGDITLRLVIAMGLGLVIGAERLVVHKEAGMKTHSLVALGAAVFVIISEVMTAKYINVPGMNPAMIVSQIVVGIGFLGAGSIMLQGPRLLGLTTASGLWVTAGIGMAAGLGFYGLAVITTILVLFILIFVYLIEKPIRRISGDIEQPRA